jgi:hypothetical protein
MKISLCFLALAVLSGCAATQPAAKPEAAKPESNKPSNTLSSDAYLCEQKAALAGVGSRAAAFDDCMKTRGRTAK